MLTSHVTANLDQWIGSGFITTEQREAIEQLMETATQDAYESGLSAEGDYRMGYDDGYDNGYDTGYSEGYSSGKVDHETEQDDWYDQGYAAAIAEHGIEE